MHLTNFKVKTTKRSLQLYNDYNSTSFMHSIERFYLMVELFYWVLNIFTIAKSKIIQLIGLLMYYDVFMMMYLCTRHEAFISPTWKVLFQRRQFGLNCEKKHYFEILSRKLLYYLPKITLHLTWTFLKLS